MKTKINDRSGDIFKVYLREEENAQHIFDDLAQLTAGIIGTQVCLINLVDLDRQMTIGSFGVSRDQLQPGESVCQYTVLQDSPLEILDLSSDPRFCNFKSLVRSGIRYYYGVPLSAPNGTKLGALCILNMEPVVLDNIKRSSLQLLAEQAARRLEEFRLFNEMKSRLQAAETLQATLAHDIRGPLAGISALSELAIDEMSHAQNEEVPQYLQHIKESGRSLIDLADGILEQKTVQSVDTLTDLRQLRRHVRKLFTPNAVKKKIKLTVNGPDGIFSLPGNRLLQAIANLVGNAIKFTPAGGQVDVNLALAEDQLTISVCDNGLGMSTEQLQRLRGHDFFSTHGTAGERGSGLGLRSVKTFAKSCSGKLAIDSFPGRGSCFELTIPAGTNDDPDLGLPPLAKAS